MMASPKQQRSKQKIKTVHTIRDNLIRTINSKQQVLKEKHPNNPYTVEFMSDVEVAVHGAAIEFLRANISELNRILADLNEVIGAEE